jgi:hypothetical protein
MGSGGLSLPISSYMTNADRLLPIHMLYFRGRNVGALNGYALILDYLALSARGIIKKSSKKHKNTKKHFT